MSRRDYVKLAAALAISNPGLPQTDGRKFLWRETVLNVAAVLQADNPRFDRAKFLSSAGYVLREY